MLLGRLVPSWWMQKTSSMESQLCIPQGPRGQVAETFQHLDLTPALLRALPFSTTSLLSVFCPPLPQVSSLISFGFAVKVDNSHWGQRSVAYWLSDPQKVYPRWEQSEIPIVIPRRRSSAFSPLPLTLDLQPESAGFQRGFYSLIQR